MLQSYDLGLYGQVSGPIRLTDLALYDIIVAPIQDMHKDFVLLNVPRSAPCAARSIPTLHPLGLNRDLASVKLTILCYDEITKI